MTRDEILALQPGPALDALVAEKVLGLALDYEFAEMHGGRPCAKELRDKYDEWGVIPEYSTDIAAAWAVVEKLVGAGIHLLTNTAQPEHFKDHPHNIEIQSSSREDRRFYVAFFRDAGVQSDDDGHGWGPTLPLALCRAALDSRRAALLAVEGA